MAAHGDGLLGQIGAGDDGDHVVGGGHHLLGVKLEMDLLGPVEQHIHGIDHPDTETGHLAVALITGPVAEGVQVHIVHGVPGGAAHPHKAGDAHRHQFLIVLLTGALVEQEELALRLFQAQLVDHFQIVEVGVHTALGGVLSVDDAGDLIGQLLRGGDGKSGLYRLVMADLKGFQLWLQSHLPNMLGNHFSGGVLLVRAAGAGETEFLQKGVRPLSVCTHVNHSFRFVMVVTLLQFTLKCCVCQGNEGKRPGCGPLQNGIKWSKIALNQNRKEDASCL